MPCGFGVREAADEALDHHDRLAALGAERIVAVDASSFFSRPSPRLVDGLEILAHAVHPDRAPDRLRRTRFPAPLPGDDWDTGVPVSYLRELVGYWLDDYDWRAQEAGLNGLPSS